MITKNGFNRKKQRLEFGEYMLNIVQLQLKKWPLAKEIDHM